MLSALNFSRSYTQIPYIRGMGQGEGDREGCPCTPSVVGHATSVTASRYPTLSLAHIFDYCAMQNRLLSLSLAEIEHGLRKQIPELAIGHIAIVAEGFRSVAVVVNGETIFLIGKHPQAVATFAKEQRLLPVLADRVPLAVPQPRWFAAHTPDFPHGFLGYPKLHGRSLTAELIAAADLDRIAADVAGFLIALHCFPVTQAQTLGVPAAEGWITEEAQLWAEIRPLLKERLPANEYVAVDVWWDRYLHQIAATPFAPVLIHGDLWYENLILGKDLQQVVGVVDFEACQIHDPALDFSPLHYLGMDFVEAVLQHYLPHSAKREDLFRLRMRRHWERREFGGLHYSLRYNDEEELQESIEKIRRGPILQVDK